MKKRYTRLTALLCAMFLLCACSVRPADPTPDTGAVYEVYYALADIDCTAAVGAEKRVVPEGTDPARGLLYALLAGPSEGELVSPFPTGVQLRSCVLEDGVLKVDLSERYGGLSGISLSIADACIALTLCQVEGVEEVYVTVEGKPIPFRSTQRLADTDIVLSGTEGEPVYLAARLCYLQYGGGLGEEERQVLITEDTTAAVAVLTALLEGPVTRGRYLPITKEDALPFTADVEDGVCYLDLPGYFLEKVPKEEREAALLLFAIVNTLCSLDNVKSVMLLVDASPLESFGGIPTDAPLEWDNSLIRTPLA